MKIKIDVEVAKECYELSKGIADLVASIKASLDDGWQPGRDIPALISEVIGRLVPALQGVELLKEEVKEDKAAVVMAIVAPISEVVDSLLK
jgi:hypothetical protein